MAIAIGLIALLIVLVLGNTVAKTAPPPEKLAADQTLSFPLTQDLADLDPALVSSAGDVDVLRNIFSGLYGFDQQLHEGRKPLLPFP